MTDSPSLAQRYAEMPRAIRWLLVAVAFIVLFYAWEYSLGSVTNRWREAADDLDDAAARVHKSEDVQQLLAASKDTIVAIGAVAAPGRDADGRTDLTNVVVDVLQNKAYSISEDDFDLTGSRARIKANVSSGITPPGHRLVALTGTVKFQASPEDAIAIISELEGHEAIEAISKVSIAKGDSRGSPKVDVNMTVEVWVQEPISRPRR